MTIRQAAFPDIAILTRFQLEMALETEGIHLEYELVYNGIQQLFQDETKGRYYVAEENGAPIGCLMTTYEWSEWHCGTVIWIQSVYVPIEHRGKGIYKALYEYIKAGVTADPSMKGIRLYADKTNHKAQAVYQKLGMNGDHYTVFEWMKS